MGYLPTSKWGDCTQCTATDVACVKVGKNLICIPCNNSNKAKIQADKLKKRNILQREKGSIRAMATGDTNKELTDKFKSKSDQLKQADNVFGDWIKNRDTVKIFEEESEVSVDAIKCPCCKKYFTLDARNGSGEKVVNVLHFISRSIYSLRFDEDNAHAGCCYCNLKQHLNPRGIEYFNYRIFLVEKFGEEAVAEMEVAHRKINRIEESQLKIIIEHYS